MGEGAGILVLESLEHAMKRGAPIIAEYLGGALNCDAYHMTDPRPDGEGVAECVRLALQDAGIGESSINYINAHATSTPVGDMAEVSALKKVFTNPAAISMNGTKSMIGHSLGAAGGQEAIAVLMAIKTSKVHPTINLEDPEDVGFHLPTKAEELKVQAAISNSFGFGGHNASVIFAPFKG
jgi:3-oxoacyl-[acyl-carrier-protein] synthase II